MRNVSNKEVLRMVSYAPHFQSDCFRKCYEFLFKVEAFVTYLEEYAPHLKGESYVNNLNAVMKVLGADKLEGSDIIVFVIKTYRNTLAHNLNSVLYMEEDEEYLDAMLHTVNDLHDLCAEEFAKRARYIQPSNLFT